MNGFISDRIKVNCFFIFLSAVFILLSTVSDAVSQLLLSNILLRVICISSMLDFCGSFFFSVLVWPKHRGIV